jgi:nitroreductase
MDALEALLTRRSVRHFLPDAIPQKELEAILCAAMYAPSADNVQPWRFVVITDRAKLETIPRFHPWSNMLKEAPAAVAICGNTEKQSKYWVQDCAAATQNLLLAAHASGLGGVWLAIYPDQARIDGLRKLLNLPEEITPLSLVALGFPRGKQPKVDRYRADFVHYNEW